MDPKQLLTQINQQVQQVGYTFEVYAIGPAGVPIPARAFMPAGFQLIVNLYLVLEEG